MKFMQLTPFGEILKDRYELSKKYGLIEKTGGIWRLTSKCKDNYDSIQYIYYLRGKIEKPKKPEQENSYEKTLNELLEM